MSMSEDEWKAEREFDRPRCACRGLGYVPISGAGNPMAVEPCGCDEPREPEEDALND